ncbi:PITH domain-containing protein 1 [Fasciola hepatica]|uniref:PITH domain-containing protein 1 n=1 Tax=Fasciola hepatica TaxID=6192 RepID=A0A4E0R6A0_FASHE|nr:PITH domain-containing protein 1 [Fasciola hepatica]
MCDHSHGGHCCHSLDISEPASAFSLFRFVDLEHMECLNEAIPGSGKSVFKPYEDRKDCSVFVESDADEELLFNIPFTGNVKLKAIIIAGDPADQHPNHIELYKNRPFMTFSDTNTEPEQSLALIVDPFGDVIYPLKPTRFSNVRHLTVHIKSNYGAETTRLHYIGLRGDFIPVTRQEVVIANYELAPNLADHKTDLIESTRHLIE